MEAADRAFEKCDVIVTPMTAITAPAINEAALATEEINGAVTAQIMRFSLFGAALARFLVFCFAHARPSTGNMTGIPAITLPAAYDALGKPIGLQIMGRWWEEHVLFRVAHAVELDVDHTRPKRFFDVIAK